MFSGVDSRQLSSGPGNWGGKCTTGRKQSPIDINKASATFDKTLGRFTLTNYDKKLPGVTFTGSNNGHALKMSFPEKVYYVSGGGLTGVYTTVQFHFHWGPDNSVGSEHTVNGKEYAAEVREGRRVFCGSSRSLSLYFVVLKNLPVFAEANFCSLSHFILSLACNTG